AGELIENIIDRMFVIRRMQHPLTQHAEMMREILRGGIHPELWHQENFSRIWIFDGRPRRKSADINIISIWYVWTCNHTLVTRDGNSIRHISFCFFRRDG